MPKINTAVLWDASLRKWNLLNINKKDHAVERYKNGKHLNILPLDLILLGSIRSVSLEYMRKKWLVNAQVYVNLYGFICNNDMVL